jgi:lysophospholipase L1-like esterase
VAAAQDDEPAYVALGDSISIDDYAGGAGCGGASLLARNRDEDFPQWRGSELGQPFLQLAADGATTATLLDSQLPRLERSGARPDVVTLTIGGNDVLQSFGHTRAARRTVGVVGARVGTALERVARVLGPGGRVAVGTVYDPSDGSGDTTSVGLPPWPDVVDVLAELNETLREVAAEHGAAVAEIHAGFLGHGLTVGNPGQGDPRPADRRLWYCDVIEPNAWGASGVRAAFWTALGHALPGDVAPAAPVPP